MPEQVQTTAFVGGEGEGSEKRPVSCTINYDFGANLNEAIGLYSTDVVYALYKGAARVKIQGIIRSMLEREESVASIEQFIAGYKLGTPLARVADPKRALAAQMANMQEGDALDIIKSLILTRGLTAEQLQAAMGQ